VDHSLLTGKLVSLIYDYYYCHIGLVVMKMSVYVTWTLTVSNDFIALKLRLFKQIIVAH